MHKPSLSGRDSDVIDAHDNDDPIVARGSFVPFSVGVVDGDGVDD